MIRVNEVAAVALIASMLYLGSGCGVVPAGYAKNQGGRVEAADMCESVRAFARAPVDNAGLRRAWFLPFGVYEDAIDFYAPMASSPSDDASKAFYANKVGQLTHYLRAPQFAASVATCLSRRYGYVSVCHRKTEETFRASFRDTRSGRSVEIAAAQKTTSVLIADKAWKGDLEQALTFGSSGDRTPDKYMQPTCGMHAADAYH